MEGLLRLHGHHALHDGEVTREGADEWVIARSRCGESDFIGLATAEHFGVGDDLLLGLFICRDELGVSGRSAFAGESRDHGAGFENDYIVTHGCSRELTDVFERENDLLAFCNLKCLDVVLHLVIAGDFDFGFGGHRNLAKRCGQ